jgi:glycerophosphoryl diester phosphodiesterase
MRVLWQDGTVADRLPSLRPTIAFAHRGGRAHAPENTLEAFALGLRLGADGLESDVWLTADGVAVLDHDGVVGGRLRRRPISSVDRGDLPDHVPTLDELYVACGAAFELSLDLKDPAAASEVVRVASLHDAAARLWLCHPDLATVASMREVAPAAKLVHSTRASRLERGFERHAADLSAAGVDALNLHHSEWTGGHVAVLHRFGRYALGWDAQFDRTLAALVRTGIDGVFSDHVDRLVDAVRPAS